MRIAMLVAIALTVTGPLVPLTPAQGQTAGRAATKQSAYMLADTLLQALSLAASARDTLAANKAEGNPITDSINGIVTQRGAVSRLNQAVVLLEPFETASDKLVRESAGELKLVFRTLADRLLAGVSLWEKLAKAKTADDITAMVPETGKSAAEIQEAWRLLPLGVAAVTHALVDPERLSDGKLAYLRLTREERLRLNADIKNLFAGVRADEKGGQVVDVSVNLFRQFLNGGWKSADDK